MNEYLFRGGEPVTIRKRHLFGNLACKSLSRRRWLNNRGQRDLSRHFAACVEDEAIETPLEWNFPVCPRANFVGDEYVLFCLSGNIRIVSSILVFHPRHWTGRTIVDKCKNMAISLTNNQSSLEPFWCWGTTPRHNTNQCAHQNLFVSSSSGRSLMICLFPRIDSK